MKTRGFEVCKGYEDCNINLPVRKTKNAVGYDFEVAEDTVIPSIWSAVFKNLFKILKKDSHYEPIQPTIVKTGVKAYFEKDEGLFLASRSSNAMKKGLILSNSIGIIDADYYGNEDNDGHIMFAFYNFFPVSTRLKKHDTIGQGFFQKILLADDDNATAERHGGFGSTDRYSDIEKEN